MSTPRGGRGGDRARGTRGSFISTRGTSTRGRGNGTTAQTNGDRPAQGVYTPRGRGATRGTPARGTSTPRGITTARGNFRGGRVSAGIPNSILHDSDNEPNSTPFAQDEYQKRLEHIRAARPRLRERFIKEGRMNPEGQMRLSDSVKLIGICTDMCPEFERVRRIVEDDVKPPECTPETEHLPRKQRLPDESRMVKAYARSAAGMDVELVSEIRSPSTCLKTLDYLMQRLDNDEFDFLHSWIWDRTRAIRKDLRTQRIEQRSDITILLTCLERSARFLLLSAHQMAQTAKEDYSHQQDIEQLNATLMSLQERYLDNRRVGYPSACEAEFYAYRLILAPLYTNSQLENELHRLPSHLRQNPRVQTAIQIYRTMQSVLFKKSAYFVQAQGNWKRFWELIKSPSVSYLMACAAEVSFQRVRHVVLDTLWRAYRMGSSKNPKTVVTWTTPRLKEVLGLDSDSEAVNLCESYGFTFGRSETGQTFLDVSAKGFDRSALDIASGLSPQLFSQKIVEQKRYGRTFSAIVQAMSVQGARAKGLIVDMDTDWQAEDDMGDEESLFVPESTTPQTNNIFSKQPNAFTNGPSTLSPAANPFLPKTAPAPEPVAKSNPFLKAQQSSTLGTNGVKPGIFDPANNAAPSTTPANPFGKTNDNPFMPKIPATSAGSATTTQSSGSTFSFLGNVSKPPQDEAVTTQSPGSSFNFFTKATQNETATTTPAKSSLPSAFPASLSNGDQQSFTPAGTPAQPALAPVDDEKQKAEEEERQKKEAEAEAQRQRAREEEARKAKELAEQQRLEAERKRQEAEQQRQRLEREARERVIQETRRRKEQEELLRTTRLRERESAINSLTNTIMFDTDEGLMLQFVENAVINTVQEVLVKEAGARRERLWKKKVQEAEVMFEQRQRVLMRSAMALWVARIEKKRRAQKDRERRKRLKELKAEKERNGNGVQDALVQAQPVLAPEETRTEPVVQRREKKASVRQARRTQERRASQASQLNGHSANHGEQAVSQIAPAPTSTNNSFGSGTGYSQAYYNSTAPMDRTETDWFELRAMGIDPSKHRKRSFGSSSDEEVRPKAEPKRAKITAQTPNVPMPPPAKTTEEQLARFRAIQQSLRRSGGSGHAVSGATNSNGQSLMNGRSSLLIEKARQMVSQTKSSKASPPNMQHDWGRSVPNLGVSMSSMRQSSLGDRTGTTSRNDRAAYWGRKSRFVPQHLYGQGPEAVRAYREQFASNSPSSTRPASTEPLAISSPIPMGQSFVPVNNWTQEQYSDEEDAASVEVVDRDLEDEEVESIDEMSGSGDDGDSEDVVEDEDEVDDEDLEGSEMYSGEEEYSEEEEEGDEDEESSEHFAHPTYRSGPPPSQNQLTQTAGTTEDDAIELSD